MTAKSRAHSAMGGKKSSKKHSGRKVKEVHIRPGKSGGYLIKHDLEPQQGQDAMAAMAGGDNTEEHVAPDMASLQQHIQDHLPEQQPGDDDMGGGGGAATAGGAGEGM